MKIRLLAAIWLATALHATASENPITQLKPLHRDTPIVSNGKAAAIILVPNTPAGKQAGGIIAKRVKLATGTSIKVTTDATRADLKSCNVIALGNLLDNQLITRLYWNRYSFADKIYPGPGRFTLRSVCNPYPWAAGKSAFLVEASDDAGLLAGANALAERIADGPDAALPWTLFSTANRSPMLQRHTDRAFFDFIEAAKAYALTGKPEFLDQAKAILEDTCALYQKEPHRHLSWPDETTSEWIMPCWDDIEESDGFTDAERLRYTNLLLTQLRAQPQHIYEFATLDKNDSIPWNHITFPLMGLYFSSRYFQAYYPEVDREQMATFHRKIEAVFGNQAKCWKPREDAAGYTAIVPEHIMTWELAENRDAWTGGSFPRDFADYVMATADPMGYSAGHGDHPLAKAPSDELRALPVPFYLTRDARLLWRLNQLSGGRWPNPFWRDVKPAPPTELAGLHVVPMPPEYYRWSQTQGIYGIAAVPHNVPLEKSFDKLTMRSGLSADSQYLLVDGFGRGAHLHYDTGMIIKYTRGGEVLLMDSDYLVRNTTEHCGMSVLRNGRAESQIPALASLDATANLPGCLMSQTTVHDYNGVDWRRTVLMVKDGPVAVFDEAVARQTADYTLWDVWKTLDQGHEDIIDSQTFHVLRSGTNTIARVHGKSSRTPDHHFYVVTTGDPALQLSPRVNANAEAVKRLRQIANIRLTAGQRYVYQNVLASVFGEPATPRVRRLDDHLFAATIGGEDYVFGIGDPDRPQTCGALTVSARAFVLGAGKLWLLDGREVMGGKSALHFGKPKTTEIEWKGPPITELLRAVKPKTSTIASTSPTSANQLQTLWNFKPDVEVYREGPEFLQTADLNADGSHEILFGAGTTLFALDASGKVLWKFAATDRVRSCATADLDRDGKVELILGSNDRHIYVLDSKGGRIRDWICDVKLVNGQGHGREPEVTALAGADINGDGAVEILAGTRNCWLLVFSAEGRELWKDSGQFHGVRRLTVADLDSDKRPEILVANRYGSIRIYSGDGRMQAPVSSELGDVSMALAHRPNGQLPLIINGSSTGVLKAWQFRARKETFQFNNDGFGVNEVACADLDGDGADEVLVASETGYVYCLDQHGRERWRYLAGTVVRDVAAGDFNGDGKLDVIFGADDGNVAILSATGQLLGSMRGDSPVILTGAAHAAQRTLGLAASCNGELRAVSSGNQ